MDIKVGRPIVTEVENFLQRWVDRLLRQPLDVVTERYCTPETSEEDGEILLPARRGRRGGGASQGFLRDERRAVPDR